MDAAAKRDAGRCGECPYLRVEQGPGGTTCARCFDPDNREIERWYGRTIDYSATGRADFRRSTRRPAWCKRRQEEEQNHERKNSYQSGRA